MYALQISDAILYTRGSQSPARGACQSGPRDSAVFVVLVYISIDIALRSGPFGFHWNLIRPFEGKV